MRPRARARVQTRMLPATLLPLPLPGLVLVPKSQRVSEPLLLLPLLLLPLSLALLHQVKL